MQRSVAAPLASARPKACEPLSAPLTDGRISLTLVEGFPNKLEERSDRLDITYPAAARHLLATAIATEPGTQIVAGLADGWSFRADAANRGIEQAWWRSPADWPSGSPIPATEPWPAYGQDPAATVGWYARRIDVDAPSLPTHIRLHRHQAEGYRVWWDGQELPVEGQPMAGSFAVLPPNLCGGAHWLVIRACHEGMIIHPESRITDVHLNRPTFWGVPALYRLVESGNDTISSGACPALASIGRSGLAAARQPRRHGHAAGVLAHRCPACAPVR